MNQILKPTSSSVLLAAALTLGSSPPSVAPQEEGGPGGRLRLYYSAVDGETKRIGVARSHDGVNFQKSPANPILEPGPPDSFDQFAVTDPAVIRVRGLYYLYYAGETEDEIEQIGLATSRDGVHFTKHPDNPVLKVGPPGSFDEQEVSNPMVLRRGGTWFMWYAGVSEDIESTGLALSLDGVHWTKFPANPVIPHGPEGSFDEIETSDPGIIEARFKHASGALLLDYYTAVDADFSVDPEGNRSIGLAFSEDGIVWQKLDSPVLRTGEDDAFDSFRVGNAEVVLLNGAFHMYYGGKTAEDVGSIGLATSEHGLVFEKHPQPILSPTEPWEGTVLANASVLMGRSKGR